MPAAVPFIPQIISGGSAIVGSLLGRKKSKGAEVKPYVPNAAYTKPMSDFGGSVLPMAQKGYQQAFDYYGGVMKDPAAATASDAASLGQQTQQLTQRAQRTMPRGGAQAQIVGQLPQQQMAAGLERRLGAQQHAADSIGSLAQGAGQQGAGVFSNLLGNELGGHQTNVSGGYLDLQRSQADRNWFGDIGGSLYDTLNAKSGGGTGGSIMDKIMGKLGKAGGRSPWDEKLPSGVSFGGMGASNTF